MRPSPSPVRLIAVAAVLAMVVASCSGTSPGALEDCDRTVDSEHSVARVWNDALLRAIRRDFPAPTAHSRNLFHLSAAMWDAWAAYDQDSTGYFIDADLDSGDVVGDREAAISYAAYRVLSFRYRDATGAEETLADLDATMEALCYSIGYRDVDGDSAADLGNRIAAAVIEFGATDGSDEQNGYTREGYYTPVNEPMPVFEPGTEMIDPNRWQPLQFLNAQTQNGLNLISNVQEFVGPYWGHVASFALSPSPDGNPLDPGEPPYYGDPATDAAFKASAVEVIRYSSLLDPNDTELIDISPGSIGDNPLGTYDGDGLSVNPVTGEPYEQNLVPHADYGRVIAEFWADGPESETPPGHWNTLANAVSDDPSLELRIGGAGPVVDRLEWDVKMYFALNGALHDSAVAAWGAKGYYDYVRPISMIRYMGGLGQSSDPDGPSYHPGGLPLVDGLVEVVTEESSAPGERHELLDRRIGSIAIRAWSGNPANSEEQTSGVEWIRAVRWVPYQRSTFVTPAFAGYVSGHSTFSRAGAEVLAALTGSPYFPRGLGEWTIAAEGLEFEAGPANDVVLQWATYNDAADQAGISRLYGGIHVRVDDLQGRIMGAKCGKDAWALAIRYFDGSIGA